MNTQVAQADHGLRTPIRVLFLCQRAESWINISGVWEAMQGDCRFNTHVGLLPYNYSDQTGDDIASEKTRQVLVSAGVEYHDWRHGGVILGSDEYDIVVFNAPYDRERPPEFHFDVVARKVSRTLYIPYGLVMGAGAKNQSYQYAQPTQMHADSVIARSHFEKSLYGRYCPTGNGHVRVLGLPRLDGLHEIEQFDPDPALLSSIGGRFAVLWNSHFSFGIRHANGLNYSTFDVLAKGLFSFAADNPDVALIWRPHPGLFGTLLSETLLDTGGIEKLRNEVEAAGIILDERPDHRHSFRASHALMTDAGSFLIEYLATGKPILYLHNPDGEGINEEGTELLKGCDTAETPNAAIQFIERIRTAGDDRRSARIQMQRAFLPHMDGQAALRVVEHIADLADQRDTKEIPASEMSWDENRVRNYGNQTSMSAFDPKTYPLNTKAYPTIALLCDRLDELRIQKRRNHRPRMLRLQFARFRSMLVETIKRHPKLMRFLMRTTRQT